MVKIGRILRPLAKITIKDCLAISGALRVLLIARERPKVIFARGRFFAMSGPWLASTKLGTPAEGNDSWWFFEVTLGS